MQYKYTARLTIENDQENVILNPGDDIDVLTAWIKDQMDGSEEDMLGEIIDNKTHQIIKHFRYVPPLE